jgi:hypothetical protein
VLLRPGEAGQLPPSLRLLDAALRQHLPGEIGDVLRLAIRGNDYRLTERLRDQVRQELLERGLIEERREKRLRLFTVTCWRRSVSGDAWARTAAEHQYGLQRLPNMVESDPEGAERVAVAAGPMTLLTPASLGALGRLRRRRRSREQYSDVYLPPAAVAVGGGATEPAFDPIESVGDLLESAAGGVEAGIDAGMDAVDSALDSVAESIDSAVDSGVDAGGGDGGDGGGNGGNSGNGGSGGGD